MNFSFFLFCGGDLFDPPCVVPDNVGMSQMIDNGDFSEEIFLFEIFEVDLFDGILFFLCFVSGFEDWSKSSFTYFLDVLEEGF